MEPWEAAIENFKRSPDQCYRLFEKTLESAAVILNTASSQLAPFEIVWVVDTLLGSPVELLATVSQRRGEDAWRKAVADALKLLARVAGVCSKYHEQIVDICLLNYEPELRKHALACLAQLAEHSAAAARHVARHVQALEEAAQCRAPVALLVGALCEHHPAAVCDELTRIWRGYLNMLDNTKNTDTVTKAALEGVCGLFKHFGDELPCSELNQFYDNLANVYINKSGCQSACYKILAEHASLFRERVAKDSALRMKLWGAAPSATMLSVYAVTQSVDRTALVNILTTEVLPHTRSPSYQVKLTALRVLAASKAFGDLSQFADVHTLEYEMRRKMSVADAELVLWCVEYCLPSSGRLLQAAILFYDNLPQAVRRRIVAEGIVNSPPELKRAAIQFVLSRSCEDPDARVWSDLMEGNDLALVGALVRGLADCLTAALDDLEEVEELSPKLSSLLRLATLAPAAKPLLAGARGHKFYKSIRVLQCRDETTLHAACLTLLQAPENVEVDPGEMITALLIIFSSDLEPKIHMDALRKLDNLLQNETYMKMDVSDAIRAVERLGARGDRSDRDVRILHRKITIFLGKHGYVAMDAKNRDSWDDDIVVDLKRSLALAFPYQGSTLKVDLKTVLLLALQHEDQSALQTLLAMLCANLSSNKELCTQRAVMRVLPALAHARASDGVPTAARALLAARLCGADAAADLLRYISSSKTCGARRLLGAALAALCEEPEVLHRVAEFRVMLTSPDATTKRAGLDIAETILTSLENNHALTKTLLPELTALLAKTFDTNTRTIFKMAAEAFIDKKQLFDKATIANTVSGLLDNVLKSNLTDVKIYRHTVNMTVRFVKDLRDVKVEELLNVIFDICKGDVDIKTMYVLAVVNNEFDIDNEMGRNILERNNCALLNCLLSLNFEQNAMFKMEVVMIFLQQYCEVILELKYKETIQLISDIITNLTPTLIKELHKTTEQCFTTLKKHWKNTPQTIIASIQRWLNTIPIKKITESIEREIFTAEHHLNIQAFDIMSNIFDIREIILPDVKNCLTKWPTILTQMYNSGRLEEYFTEEMSYFNDMLMTSLKFLSNEDVIKILKGVCNKEVAFASFFIEGFFELLTEIPFILMNGQIGECSVLLNDVVRFAVRRHFKEGCGNVVELVDELWPTYENHATFVQKHCLLVNLRCLGPGTDSNAIRWVTRVVCSTDASIEERTMLLCFLPEESFKLPEVAAAVSSLFPARLRELRPALLEAAAEHPATLLPTIAALAGNDTSTGWWDAALESCVASAATKCNVDICGSLYDKCHSDGACERVLVPVLRYSSTEVCERFLGSVLDRILGNLSKRPKGDPSHPGYRRCWEDYMTSLYLLLVAFEKLPTSSLESPTSVLYSSTNKRTPWHVVRETCTLCHRLRESLHCPTPEHQLYPIYSKLQCQIYNVMCAAICRRRPAAALYLQLVGAEALQRIVGERLPYELPIRASWTKRTKSMPVAVPPEPSTLSPSHTQRSRIFLRTLSEDPMLFDLHTSEVEQMETQDISLVETPLNNHPCAGTLTALFRHVAGTAALASVWPAVAELMKEAGTNLKWLLAQMVCNCKEELKPQASALLPGLLAVLGSVETGSMNGLHIDVLDTILYWREETSEDLNSITHQLITTCMEHRRAPAFDGLLRTLQGWLQLYGAIQVQWSSFEVYYEDQRQDTQKALFKLITLITKIKYIPQTLSKIMARLNTEPGKLNVEPAKLAECFGVAMAACGDVGERGAAMAEFGRYLEKCSAITGYVRVLYYACLGCAECCGEKEFRKIADYVTKATSSDRTKCLHVLSAYLSRDRRGGLTADMFDTIDLSNMLDKDVKALLLLKHGLSHMDETLKRRCVTQVTALRPAAAKDRALVVEVMRGAYEDLFSSPPQPPAKRQKTESTPLLNLKDDAYANSILTCLGVYAVDLGVQVSAAAREALMMHLDEDLGARFAECFLLTLHLPVHTQTDLCTCVSALLDMLLGAPRRAGALAGRLREEPLQTREEPESRLLTLSKTLRSAFRSYGSTSGRTHTRGSTGVSETGTKKPAIDVQITMDSILQSLLDFAKTTPEAARSMLTEVLRAILPTTKFDVGSTLAPLLGTLLDREPTELTPVYIDVCRAVGAVGIMAPVEKLRTLTAGSEGEELTKLLYEEVAMRCFGEAMFQLGQPEDIIDEAMETTTFSIQDLKLAFGKLSNWDDLTQQQQRRIKKTLPPLWTDRRDFIARLDSYQGSETDWFDKMAATLKHGAVDWRWLQQAGRWPGRQFHVSALAECGAWHQGAAQFRSSECMAEWAARLMIRSSYYNTLQNSDTDKLSKLSRSHELKWCMRANEMGIPDIALQCVERNVEELTGVETLPWLRQKLLALRRVARDGGDGELLRDVLKKVEKYTPQFTTDPSVSIEMYHLMLLLHKDLKSLQHTNLQAILETVDRSASKVDWKTCSKEAVSSVYEVAIGYYDEALETGTMTTDTALSNMSELVSRAAALDMSRVDLLLAVLLHRIHGFRGQLEVDPSRKLLENLSPVLLTLDSFSIELLKKNTSKFPAHLQRTLAAMFPKDASVEKYRKCLQLVCDPGHLLTHYCEELVSALRESDPGRWRSTLDRMRAKIFDNPYTGPSYKLLDKYKEDLYNMYEFEPTPDFATRAESKLQAIVLAVRREPQATLRLADLCPSLLAPMADTGIEKWFGFRGVKIVKLYDKVQIFTDSVRRPAVLSALLACGRRRRAVLKAGEPLARDAAAQRVVHVAARGSGYSVTLLDEDSAIIEFLEGHERLRSVIATACNLDVLHTVSRPPDRLLLESGAASLQAHQQLCAKVPATALRSAMEQTSSSVQHFVWRKRNFTDSLADMTLMTWLLGLSDRHLQNVLWSDLGARGVDWADVWRRADLPARLTRCLLAAADCPVLEARLQSSLEALRGSALLLEAVVRVAFHWMPDLEQQMQYVRGILRGTATSYDVCRDVTRRSHVAHKDTFLQTLDRTLGDCRRERYSVEEQVSCLLRHCTSPELLSLVRAGWEPWV